MRRFLFLSLALISALLSSAQDGEYYGSYAFEGGTPQVVFSDTAFVRAAPGGAVQDTLYEFARVDVVRRLSTVTTIGRKTAPWYEVAYAVRGVKRTGCLWGGALALGSAERDGVHFLFNVLSYPQAGAMRTDHETEPAFFNTVAIKAKPREGERQQCFYSIYRESATVLPPAKDEDGTEIFPSVGRAQGLPPGAKFLVHFYISGEACGIPSYQITAAWSGDRLIAMPLLESVSDAGVFASEEAYIYPAERGGRRGHLGVRTTTDEYQEEDGKENIRAKRSIKTVWYRWDEKRRAFEFVR